MIIEFLPNTQNNIYGLILLWFILQFHFDLIGYTLDVLQICSYKLSFVITE